MGCALHPNGIIGKCNACSRKREAQIKKVKEDLNWKEQILARIVELEKQVEELKRQ